MSKLSVVIAYDIIWNIQTPGLRPTQRDSNTKRADWWEKLPKGAGKWVDPEATPRVWEGLRKRNLPSRIYDGEELVYECHDYDVALRIRSVMERCGDLYKKYKHYSHSLWEPAALAFWEQLARLARDEPITCVSWVERPEEFRPATPSRPQLIQGKVDWKSPPYPGRPAEWLLQFRGFRIGALQCLRRGQAREGIESDAVRLPVEAVEWDKKETMREKEQPEYDYKRAFLALYNLAQEQGLLRLEEVERPLEHARWVMARSATRHTGTKHEVHCTRAGPISRLAEQWWPTAELVIVEVTGYRKVVSQSEFFPAPPQLPASSEATAQAEPETPDETPLARAMREARERKKK